MKSWEKVLLVVLLSCQINYMCFTEQPTHRSRLYHHHDKKKMQMKCASYYYMVSFVIVKVVKKEG